MKRKAKFLLIYTKDNNDSNYLLSYIKNWIFFYLFALEIFKECVFINELDNDIG